MNSKVKVTIGLCVKNAEATIREAIDGILRQDFPHQLMEIIAIDGCSRDQTFNIIKKKFGKSDIAFRIEKENSGLGLARQMVVEKARGDYIVWVDGDVILPKDYVRKQIQFMENNPRVGIAGGRYGLCPGKSLVSLLENIVSVTGSEFGMAATSNLGQLPGTEGSIYRTVAIRQVEGFDVSIKGAAEDIEAAYRIKKAGWLLVVTNERFQEVCRETWKLLWNQYFWYGYGACYVFHKNSGVIDLYKMVPISGFVAGVLHAIRAYKLFRRKIFFLLPIHYTFKRTAWLFGFAKGCIDGYKA